MNMFVDNEAGQSGSEGHTDDEEEAAPASSREIRQAQKLLDQEARRQRKGNKSYKPPSSRELSDDEDDDQSVPEDPLELQQERNDLLNNQPLEDEQEALNEAHSQFQHLRLQQSGKPHAKYKAKHKVKRITIEADSDDDVVQPQQPLTPLEGDEEDDDDDDAAAAVVAREGQVVSDLFMRRLESLEPEDEGEMENVVLGGVANTMYSTEPSTKTTKKRKDGEFSDDDLNVNAEQMLLEAERAEAQRMADEDERDAELSWQERFDKSKGDFLTILSPLSKATDLEISPDEVTIIITSMLQKWGLSGDKVPPYELIKQVGYPDVLGQESMQVDIHNEVKKKSNSLRLEWTLTKELMLRVYGINGVPSEMREQMTRLMRTILAVQEIVYNSCVFQEARVSHFSYSPVPLSQFMFDASSLDLFQSNPVGQIWQFTCYHAQRDGLKLQDDYFYKQVITDDNYPTHSYTPYMTVTAYIYHIANRHENYKQWENVTKSGTVEAVTKHIVHGYDPDIVRLDRNRQAWSFKDGIYTSWDNRFYPYAEHKLPDVTSAKYFELEFKDRDDCGPDWVFNADKSQAFNEKQECIYDASGANGVSRELPLRSYMSIETPVFDKILIQQGFSRNVQKLLWVMMGRMTTMLGDPVNGDNWQVFPYLWGIAGTGKSTIWAHWVRIYLASDSAAVANNIEPVFGLEPILGKYIWYCLEVKKNFRLDQALFQQMVSGEELSVAGKNKTAKTIRWSIHGCGAGNEIMSYADKSGSMSRRMLTWMFNTTLDENEIDTQLMQRLFEEMPLHIKKATQAYIHFKNYVGKRNLWACIDPYFKKAQAKMREQTDPVCAFLNQMCVHDKTSQESVPFDTFQNNFIHWCKTNHPALELIGMELRNSMKANRVEFGSSASGALDGLGIPFINQQSSDNLEDLVKHMRLKSPIPPPL